MPNVVFFTSLAPETAALLTGMAPAGYDVTTAPIRMDETAQIRLVSDADFLILFPSTLPSTVLRAAAKVKLIQLVSAGFDTLDVKLCKEMGIPVANNGGTNSIDVAEHTLALILAWYRRMGEMDANVRHSRWSAIDSGVHTHTIHGKTVGLIGLGNIGRKVARLLRAFGATVIYADAFPASPEVEADLGVRRVELDELLAQADVVSLHTPLNDSTRGMIGLAELAKMKPTALLVNTCRGPVVNESALATALKSRAIAGAALDVLEKEPPSPDNPLLAMDNVLLTPHIAGVTRDTWARRGEFIFANLQRVWDGQPPQARIA